MFWGGAEDRLKRYRLGGATEIHITGPHAVVDGEGGPCRTIVIAWEV